MLCVYAVCMRLRVYDDDEWLLVVLVFVCERRARAHVFGWCEGKEFEFGGTIVGYRKSFSKPVKFLSSEATHRTAHHTTPADRLICVFWCARVTRAYCVLYTPDGILGLVVH